MNEYGICVLKGFILGHPVNSFFYYLDVPPLSLSTRWLSGRAGRLT